MTTISPNNTPSTVRNVKLPLTTGGDSNSNSQSQITNKYLKELNSIIDKIRHSLSDLDDRLHPITIDSVKDVDSEVTGTEPTPFNESSPFLSELAQVYYRLKQTETSIQLLTSRIDI